MVQSETISVIGQRDSLVRGCQQACVSNNSVWAEVRDRRGPCEGSPAGAVCPPPPLVKASLGRETLCHATFNMSTSPTSSFAHLDKDNVHKQKTFSDVNDLVAWYKTNDVKEETRAVRSVVCRGFGRSRTSRALTLGWISGHLVTVRRGGAYRQARGTSDEGGGDGLVEGNHG